MASRLLRRALPVQRDESGEHFLLGQIHRPAIGLGHGSVDLVMIVLEDEDETIIAHAFIVASEQRTRLQLLQHIVHLGEGDLRMISLHLLAMRVEPFGEASDAGTRELVGFREWERIEAAGFHINRIPFIHSDFRRVGNIPSEVNSAYQYAECKGIIQCEYNDLVVREDRLIKELKDTVLCSFDSCNLAREARKCFPQKWHVLSK